MSMSILTRLRCTNIHRLHFTTSRKLLEPHKIYRQPPRFIFHIPRKSPEYYKELDDVPDHYPLIYHNRMERYVVGGQIAITLSTIVLILFAGLKEDFTDLDLSYEGWSSTVKKTEGEEIIYIACFMLIVIIMHIFLTRTALRMYKRPGTDQYVMIMPGNLPLLREKFTFKRDQFEVLAARGVLPWQDSRYRINMESGPRRVLLLENFFRLPADLSILLGIQRDPEIEQ